MSDWPQLERRLVDSARQRARRRRTRGFLALIPVAASLVLVALLLGRSPEPKTIPSDERPVPTQTPADTTPSVPPLERDYGVFRRARSARDRLPITGDQRRVMTRGCNRSSQTCIRPDTARLAYREGDLRIFLLRATRRVDLCVAEYVGRQSGGYNCTIAGPERAAKPMGTYGLPRRSRPARGWTVFPDAVARVAYTFADGTTAVREVNHNIAYVSAPAAITSLSWTANGQRHIQQVADFDPLDKAIARSCPRLDPLPAAPEPAAEQAARAAAPALFDVEPSAILAARPRAAQAPDVDEIRRRACGDVLAERSLVVALDLRDQPAGALLVGFRDGTPIVWGQVG